MGVVKITNEAKWVNINGSKFKAHSLTPIDTKDDQGRVYILHYGKKFYNEPFTNFRDSNNNPFDSASDLISYISSMNVDSIYADFLASVKEESGELPPQAIIEASGPLVSKYKDFDFLNIPQFNVDDELWSIIGDNMTVTGGGNGSRFDENQILQTGLTNNRPRYTFNPETGDFEGALIEKEVTNNALQSLSLSDKSLIQVNRSLNSGISLDGNQNASEFINTLGTYSRRINDLSATVTDGDATTFSCYFKSNGLDTVCIFFNNLNNEEGGNYYGINEYANIIDSTVSNNIIKIKQIKDNWFRVWITCTPEETKSSVLRIVPNGKTDVNLIEGDGVSGLFAFGLQVENNDNPTSLIRTTTNPVTRDADTYIITGLINTTSSHIKFYIKNGKKYAEYYNHSESELTVYEDGILIDTQESYTPSADWEISSSGSDKYLLLGYKEDAFTPEEIQNL